MKCLYIKTYFRWDMHRNYFQWDVKCKSYIQTRATNTEGNSADIQCFQCACCVRSTKVRRKKVTEFSSYFTAVAPSWNSRRESLWIWCRFRTNLSRDKCSVTWPHSTLPFFATHVLFIYPRNFFFNFLYANVHPVRGSKLRILVGYWMTRTIWV